MHPTPTASTHRASKALRPELPPRAISFAGCAWLLPYHLGAAQGLSRYIELETPYYLGASSGAIAAVACASGLLPRDVFEQTLASASRYEGSRRGPFGRMSALVRHALDSMLPVDAHKRVAGRFFASVTTLPRLQNRLEPRAPLTSRSELIDLVLASCYIPLYYERIPFFRGMPYLDGGASDVLPKLDTGTLTVSPMRSHGAHICPRNRHPALRVLFPKPQALRALFADGERDATAFMEHERVA